MSMNVRKCWTGNPCPAGQKCHSNGADVTGQGICVPDTVPTHLNISYSCEGGRCVLQQRPPTGNGMTGPYYGTMATCQSACHHSTPTHLTMSYDCNNGNCTMRYDDKGAYKSKSACDSQCAKGSLNMAWGCSNGHKPGARCSKMPGFADGKTLFANEASCEKKTSCGAVPANLNMAWQCRKGHKPGARCVQVPGFADGKTLFADEASCEHNSTCGAVPVNIMSEPYWEVGVGEGNPLQMISTANVGNINNAVINYM